MLLKYISSYWCPAVAISRQLASILQKCKWKHYQPNEGLTFVVDHWLLCNYTLHTTHFFNSNFSWQQLAAGRSLKFAPYRGDFGWTLLPKECYGSLLSGRGLNTQPSNWEILRIDPYWTLDSHHQFKWFFFQ